MMPYVLSLIAGVLAAAPAAALAQARGGFSVGTLRSVGSLDSDSTTFQRYSYGLSGTAAPPPAAEPSASYPRTLRRSGGGGAGAAARRRPGQPRVARRLYQPTEIRFNAGGLGQGSIFKEANRMAGDRVSFGGDVRTTFGLTASPVETDGPIRSFAPNNTGRYATYLRTGQDAMRVGQYTQAAEHFRQAALIGPRRPEALLSIAHADFGAGRYASMAHRLRQAIRHNPDLPARDIRIRSFFSDVGTFLTLRDALIEQTEAVPDDARQWMALGYVLWYDNDTARATEAWRRAYHASTDPTISGAIEAWWDGAVATGRISGPLEEATTTVTTRPAAPPPPAAATVGETPDDDATADR